MEISGQWTPGACKVKRHEDSAVLFSYPILPSPLYKLELMKLKTTFIFLAIVTIFSVASAADTDSVSGGIVARINESGHVRVTQPSELARRLMPSDVAETAETPGGVLPGEETAVSSQPARTPVSSRVGYRVQVFDDNNPRTARSQANAKRQQMSDRFPEFQAYVTFNSPYWCVKVGDFRSRSEAEAAMREIRQAFPALSAYIRVVRDRINLFD